MSRAFRFPHTSLLCLALLPLFAAAALAQAQRQEESEDHYRKWLEEDVLYIIKEEERRVFLDLSTDDERDAFIEQFWRRRDPNPRTADNEYKSEHYRRIAYANDVFHAGIPGWKTDRGRIYIMYGPPDRKESHPNGGRYERKLHEGGGTTQVWPFEVWEYRYIEGVGSDIELEFVDQSDANLYRLSMDPQEKDVFLHVPGMGLTFDEEFNPAFDRKKSADRVLGRRESGDIPGIPERAKDHPFQKAELLSRVESGPAIRYNDLKEMVSTQITYDQLPFEVTSHYQQVGQDIFQVSLTLAFPNKEISFEETPEGMSSHLQLYGLVRTITRQIITEFDDDIEASYSAPQFQQALTQTGTFQKKVRLAPGKYKLDIILKDTVSGRIGSTTAAVSVPGLPQERLSTSSVFLTQVIEPSSFDKLAEPFVVGAYKVKPQVDRSFPAGGSLGFYLEIYNYQTDQSTQLPSLKFEYQVVARGRQPDRLRTVKRGLSLSGNRLYLARMVQLSSFDPGRYDLVCSITDTLNGESLTLREPFQVSGPELASN